MTKDEAKAKGLRFYSTGKPCRRGHHSVRYVIGGACVACALRPEAIKQQRQYWRRPENRARAYERQRLWSEENRERVRANDKRWIAANRGRWNALGAAYEAAKINATPLWLTAEQREQIVALYDEAQRLTRETGVEHHVDHIVPLRAKRHGEGRVACGMHVPWNLQVLTGLENLSKNAYDW